MGAEGSGSWWPKGWAVTGAFTFQLAPEPCLGRREAFTWCPHQRGSQGLIRSQNTLKPSIFSFSSRAIWLGNKPVWKQLGSSILGLHRAAQELLLAWRQVQASHSPRIWKPTVVLQEGPQQSQASLRLAGCLLIKNLLARDY